RHVGRDRPGVQPVEVAPVVLLDVHRTVGVDRGHVGDVAGRAGAVATRVPLRDVTGVRGGVGVGTGPRAGVAHVVGGLGVRATVGTHRPGLERHAPAPVVPVPVHDLVPQLP